MPARPWVPKYLNQLLNRLATYGSDIAGADVKAILANADSIGISDSENDNILKKLTFVNLWTWIRGLADLIYQPISTALGKITEAGGLPLWDGGDWPGGISVLSGAVTEPISPTSDMVVVFTEAVDPATMTTPTSSTGSSKVYDSISGLFLDGVLSTSDNISWTFDPDIDMTEGNQITWFLSTDIEGSASGTPYSGLALTFVVAAPITPFEDYTTYTEVDPGGALGVTSNKIEGIDIPRNADAFLYKSHTENGDFTHDFELTLSSGDDNSQFLPWCLSDTIDDGFGMFNGGTADSLYCVSSPAVSPSILIVELINGSRVASAVISLVLSTKYYCRVVRDEAVGSFGECTLYVYSDPGRTSLVDSAAITLTAKTDFQYVYGVNNWNSGNALDLTADVENLLLTA